jgi:hypothetical protein
MVTENKKISVKFLESKGFVRKKTQNVFYYEKNNFALILQKDFHVWILCGVNCNIVYSIAPMLFIETENELIKYYQECTGQKL